MKESDPTRHPTDQSMAVEQDETAWVRALAKGDAAAATRLYDTFQADVLGWCWRLGSGLIDPEDAAHDVFVVALARIGSFRGQSSMRTWMYGVTRRVLANHRRRARTRLLRERLTKRGEVWGTDRGPTPADAASSSEQRRLVHECLESLSAKHREVIVLCSLEGRTGREVAELLGVPEATVYSRLHYARTAFREAAGRFGLVPSDHRSGKQRRSPGRRGGRR